MKPAKKHIPKFKNEDDERNFWAKHSPLDYVDISHAKRAHAPNLKPSLKSISIRLPEDMIDSLKIMANKHDVPYQGLLKMLLAKQLKSSQF